MTRSVPNRPDNPPSAAPGPSPADVSVTQSDASANAFHGVVLYHVVYAHEGFGRSADALFQLVKKAATEKPGQPRQLHLEIVGHRNEQGGFDHDMFQLQESFLREFLLPYMTKMHAPLVEATNPNQREDLPPTLADPPGRSADYPVDRTL
jgi:hypothetical protein